MRTDLSRQQIMTQRRIEQLAGNLCITIQLVPLAIIFLLYDLIRPDSDFWHIRAVQQLARLYALRYDLSSC